MFKICLRSSKTVLCADPVVRQGHWILAKFWRLRFSFVRFVRNSRTFSWWLNAWLRLYWKQTDRLHKNSEKSGLSTINNRCYYQIYQQQNFCLLVDLWTDWNNVNACFVEHFGDNGAIVTDNYSKGSVVGVFSRVIEQWLVTLELKRLP